MDALPKDKEVTEHVGMLRTPGSIPNTKKKTEMESLTGRAHDGPDTSGILDSRVPISCSSSTDSTH